MSGHAIIVLLDATSSKACTEVYRAFSITGAPFFTLHTRHRRKCFVFFPEDFQAEESGQSRIP